MIVSPAPTSGRSEGMIAKALAPATDETMFGPCLPAMGAAARAGVLESEPAAATAAAPPSRLRRVSAVMESSLIAA